MSIDYAAGLSHCDDLGICGLDEIFDDLESVKEKVIVLAKWLREYHGSCVVHVGAGLSTAAGIRDFRGKRGVWTEMIYGNSTADDVVKEAIKQEKKDDKVIVGTELANQISIPNEVKSLDDSTPTFAHMCLKSLCDTGFIRHIVSQNVDGLFLKANFKRSFLSELHGDFYLDECTRCRSRFIRSTASQTMRLTRSHLNCPRQQVSSCKGFLRDTILDWESPIPFRELQVATRESKRCKLHICIGTSLQLSPSKDLVHSRSKARKLVIINLQPTKYDEKADLVIHYYADDVMRELANQLDLDVCDYDKSEDPTKNIDLIGTIWKK